MEVILLYTYCLFGWLLLVVREYFSEEFNSESFLGSLFILLFFLLPPIGIVLSSVMFYQLIIFYKNYFKILLT